MLLEGELQPQGGRPRYACYAAGPEGEVVPVLQDEPDDLSKPQGDDGQVVAPEPQDREAEQQAEGGCQGTGQRKGKPEPQAEMVVHQGVEVCTHGIEGHIPQVQESGQPHHDVQAQAEHDIHECRDHDGGLVAGKDEWEDACQYGQYSHARDEYAPVGPDSLADPPLPGLLFILGLAHFLSGKEISPHKRQDKGPDAHIDHVHPAPLKGPVQGVHLHDHERERKEHEPQGGSA